ncbi:MAG: hypothetical protein K8S94_16160, partial [Planctomycetia bacterium]|nr:hypothetical protein [Planctomycetia bacterium]
MRVMTTFAAVVLLGSAAIHAADIHVAGGGDDAADGAAGRPAATLARALELVRDLRVAEPGRTTPLVVELAAGRHELAAPLVIGPEHSGTEASPTVFRAAAGTTAEVSGGRVITGWQVDRASGSDRWTVHLPDVESGDWSFMQLFVNGQRRFRPRLPAQGWFTIA